MGKSIWAENGVIDNLLAKLQMQAIETHVKDSFTLSAVERNRIRMKIKDKVNDLITEDLSQDKGFTESPNQELRGSIK